MSAMVRHKFKAVRYVPDELMTNIVKARLAMIMNAPFFGNVVMRMELLVVADDDPYIKTAATDGHFLMINGKFFQSLLADERTFVIGHELGHSIFEHAGEDGRRLDRHPLIWNWAADHAVNLMLVDAKIGAPVTSNGFKIICDAKYKDMSVEQIYDDLYQAAKKAGGKGGKMKGPGSPGGGSPGDEEGEDDPTTGQSDGKGGKVLDEHIETGSVREAGTDEDGNTIYEIAERGQVPDGDRRKVQQEMRANVIAAARTVEQTQKDSSMIPAGVRRMIDEWLTPQIDWRSLLATRVSELFRDDYTYSRVSKKSWSTNVIMPGHKDSEHVKIAAGLDQSGSISQEEATLFMTELWGIMQTYGDFEIHVWTYDTEIYNHQVFTPENLEALKDYQVFGNGGTDFMANYDHMKKIELVPDQFINFTDGCPGGSWGDEDYCDSIFVITEKNRKPPFGQYAYFDD